ncbi:MAG: TolC family protein [Bacteroidota bacterium]
MSGRWGMILVFWLCCAGILPAQTPPHGHAHEEDPEGRYVAKVVPVDLETILRLAGVDNLQIRALKQKIELAEVAAAQQKDWWLPTLYGGLTFHHLSGRAMNGDGRIFVDVTRDNYWAGVGAQFEWDFSKGTTAARLAEREIRVLKHESETAKLEVLRAVTAAYYELSAAQAEYNALLGLLSQTDTIARQLEIQHEAGLRYKSEVLLAKSNYQHTRLGLIRSREAMERQSARLIDLLNIQGDPIRLVSVDSSLVPVELVSPEMLSTDREYAYTRRPEFRGLQAGLSVLELERDEYSKALLRPTLRLNVTEGGFGRVFFNSGNQFQFNGALTWRFPLERVIHNRGAELLEVRKRLQHSQMEAMRNRITREVSESWARVQSAEQQIDIAREALELSGEALRQSIARQKLGTAQPFQVFQAQEYYHRAQMDYIQATRSYNLAQWELFLSLGKKE